MLWLLDRSASLHSLIKRTLGDIHLVGRPIFFILKRLPVLPSGGITNTRGQNTRSSHLSSGMCEWRGHHCAKSSSGAGQDVRAVVAGQYGDLHALTKGPRTAVISRAVLMHVQPRERESQLVCGKTTKAWASFQRAALGDCGS